MPGSMLDLLADELARYHAAVGTTRVLPGHRHAWLAELQRLRALARAVRDCADDVETRIAASLDGGPAEIDGRRYVAWRERHRRGWDHDALVRAVLDSRRADPDTGEIRDETPVSKIRAVWPLAGSDARRSELRARRIDPDDYCTVEWGRLRLRELR